VLNVQGLRRAPLLVTVAAGLVVGLAACSGASGDRTPGGHVPLVAVDHRLFSLSWEGDDVCLHGAYPTLPACLPVDVRSTEAVLSALLAPLDPAADLLVVVTRPEVVPTGLGPSVVRRVMATAAGDDHVAVSVALWAAPTPTVCALVDAGRGRTALVVHRAVAVSAGRPAEGAGDGC
jgi:hypothetical protein